MRYEFPNFELILITTGKKDLSKPLAIGLKATMTWLATGLVHSHVGCKSKRAGCARGPPG
jgi:hypothetical protein